MPDKNHLVILSVAWVVYFILHSLLASIGVKRWVEHHYPRFLPWYRLAFNLVAVILLLVPLWLLYSKPGELLIDWSGYWQWFSHMLALLAILGFIWSAKYYDGGEFIGLKQIRDDVCKVEDQESFHISPLHRFVRHPWYFLGLILIWTRDMDAGFLVSAILLTAYIAIGSKLEEKKLLQYHGDVYRLYARQVPGFIPLPWKYLTRQQAELLVSQAGGTTGKTQ